MAPPAYGPPAYGYYAPPASLERGRQIDRTKTGILLLLIGTLLSWIPYAAASIVGYLLIFVGAILVIVGRKAFGEKHSRNVVVSLVMFIVGIIAYVVLALFVIFALVAGAFGVITDPTTAINNMMGAVYVFLVGSIILSAVIGIAEVLFTYALQNPLGRILLWAGFASGLGVQIVIIALALPIIPDIAGPSDVNQDAVNAILALGASYWFLGVLSSACFAAADYIAWSRINRGEIPAPATPPPMPAMAPPTPPPAPPM